MDEVWTIRSSDGNDYSFRTHSAPGDTTYDSHYHVLKGASGHHGMPVSFTSDKVPFMAGEELREEIIGMREIYMPVRIQGTTPAELTQYKQSLRRSLNAKNSLQLWITNAMGDTRMLYCRYRGGFDVLADDDKRSPTFVHVGLKFIAHDPYFYDIPTNEITHTATYEPPTDLFFDDNTWLSVDEDDAWRLGTSTLSWQWTVLNDGDIEAYPVWQITGPGNAPVLKNLTTSKNFALDYTLAEGETITIDMREHQHTAESVLTVGGDSTTTNVRKYMVDGMRDMWSLEPGLNYLAIEIGNGAAGAAVYFSFTQRFEGI